MFRTYEELRHRWLTVQWALTQATYKLVGAGETIALQPSVAVQTRARDENITIWLK